LIIFGRHLNKKQRGVKTISGRQIIFLSENLIGLGGGATL
jgi:hypothetical protein